MRKTNDYTKNDLHQFGIMAASDNKKISALLFNKLALDSRRSSVLLSKSHRYI
jgi:hypothetical protein